MTSPLVQRPGSVPGEEPDASVTAHYSDPVAEQRALEREAGWVDRSHRGVVRISGPDRLAWLHTLLSQHMEALEPGTASEALRLDAHGRIKDHLSLVDDGSAVWAHVEPGTGVELARFLDSMRFLYQVEVADLTDTHAVLTVMGPRQESAAAAAVEGEDVVVRRAAGETDLFVPRKALERVADRLTEAGARPAGLLAYEALRVAAHRPRLGLDSDERAIPHEMAWVGPAVHLDKGCYPGQETVARVHNLGRPPRRLVLLHLDGSVDRLPARGSAVEREGRSVGTIGTVVRHHELGPIALALVKRNVPVDEELVVDGVAAAQEVIVSPDTGANAQVHLRRTRE
jgi:tRNA-modifying protein YgfZ